MRYCLVHSRNKKQIVFLCKRDLLFWISEHRVFLTSRVQRDWQLYRCRVYSTSFSYYSVGFWICSLRDYIVKHKLF